VLKKGKSEKSVGYVRKLINWKKTKNSFLKEICILVFSERKGRN